MCPGQGRHAHNRIHRRPDIVAHGGEEIAFGPIGLLGQRQRPLQRFLAPALRSHCLCHILAHNTDHLMVPVPPEYINLFIPPLILLQTGKDKIISPRPFLQAGEHVI